MPPTADKLLELLRIQGPMAPGQLQRALGISQPTLSRLVRRAGTRVIRLGKGRATRYAATREIPGMGVSTRLYAVNEDGSPREIGKLTGLTGTVKYVLSAAVEWCWLMGEDGKGEFGGLPYYLYDLRPQGFLGRQIAERIGRHDDGYPGNPEAWSDDQVVRYLCRHGSELAGNLIVGDTALDRFLANGRKLIADRATHYPARATRILAEEDFGSSAGGEQPKFTAYTEDAGHVIVKFSPAGETAEAVRWRDLLIAEYHALSVLGGLGIAVADCELYEFGGRVFLESRRFDRAGRWGRKPALSLTAVDAEFAGEGHHWIRSMRSLHAKGLVSQASFNQVRLVHTYGMWIANSDMHLGNLTLKPDAGKFRLHPVYDMVPMRLAPRRGEIPVVEMTAPARNADNFDLWEQVGEQAALFWQRFGEDVRVSEAMRELALEHAARCRTAIEDHA